MAFNPDAYLAEKSSGGDFNPDAYLAEKTTQPKAQGFMQGLTTNLPTQGFGAMIGRATPATIGSTIGGIAGGVGGGTLGMVGGPIGGVGGAIAGRIEGSGAGAGMGEAARQALVSYMNPQDKGQTLGNVAGQVGAQALGGAAGQGIVEGAGAALGSKFATETGGQALQAINATPKKYGAALIEGGASTIARGKQLAGKNIAQQLLGSDNLMRDSYQAFENYTGMTGLRPLITKGAKYLEGKIVPASAEGGVKLAKAGSSFVEDVALRVEGGESVNPQTLYVASQMANDLRASKTAFAPEAEKLMAGSMTQWKNTIEDALQQVLPEYKNLRTDRFMAAAGERAGSVFPLNKDMSVNALRSYGAMQTGLGAAGALIGGGKDRSLSGAEHGAAIGVGLGALATSPKLAFGAIQAGSRAVQSGLPQLATKAIGSMSLDEIYQYLRGQGATP